MMMIRYTLVLMLIGLMTGCLKPEVEFKIGRAYFERQDYHLAFRYLYPLAQKGQPEAEYAIGYMYFYGQGVFEDKRKAEVYFVKAAAQGHVLAQKALEMLYPSKN